MLSGRCCATELPSRPVLQLDIFIEILLRGWVNRAGVLSYQLVTRKTGTRAAIASNSLSGASLSTGTWARAPGARRR